MFDDPSILPRPALQRIIPTTHAQWNATKGGSDTITKLVDDCYIHPPRIYTNFESVAVSRCISILLSTIFKLFQIISAKDDLDTYPSMENYCNAASHRATFKRILRMIYVVFKEEAEELSECSSRTRNGEVLQDRTNLPQRRQQRRVRFNDSTTVPQQMDFAPDKTFHTPVKAKKKQMDRGTTKEQVLQRTKNCTGFPFEIYCQAEGSEGKDPRRECYICSTKTKWQCINCKFYFCMSNKASKKREEQFYFVKQKDSASTNHETTRIYGKSCFHVAHEGAIRDKLNQDDSPSN